MMLPLVRVMARDKEAGFSVLTCLSSLSNSFKRILSCWIFNKGKVLRVLGGIS